MDDLHFLIVNSHLNHARILKHELENRVSFEVFQDTEDKGIWKLMQGGKDDIYVYDRCGRLAYYIPFPLSIIRKGEALIPSAILAAYYRSPCGESCERNASDTLEAFLNNITQTQETENEVFTTTELYTSEEHAGEIENSTSTIPSTLDSGQFAEIHYHEKFDYEVSNETEEYLSSNETLFSDDKSFFNSIFSIFFSSNLEEPSILSNFSEVSTENGTSTTNEPSTNATFILTSDNETVSDEIESAKNESEFVPLEEVLLSTPTPLPKKKLDRCAEVGNSVCQNWSKRRLLRAQSCCAQLANGFVQHYYSGYCQNFGKKRCKKIQTILKCCIKTSMRDEMVKLDTTVESVINSTNTISEEKTTYTTCCKTIPSGQRICRVAESVACEVGEYISESHDEVHVQK